MSTSLRAINQKGKKETTQSTCKKKSKISKNKHWFFEFTQSQENKISLPKSRMKNKKFDFLSPEKKGKVNTKI